MPFPQQLMHENGSCPSALHGLNMQGTIKLFILMISSASVCHGMENSIKDQQIMINNPSVKDDCIIKNTIKKR